MSKTILTVDDSRTMRDMLKLALSDAGYRVVQADDGVHGLEVLAGETPDVIVTDINMPRLDGFGFIEGVRGDNRHRVGADSGADDGERRREERARPPRRRNGVDHQAVRSGEARRRHPARRGVSRPASDRRSLNRNED